MNVNAMTKPTIVLAPGFMTDYDMWSDFVPFLKDYNVLYADFSEGTTLQELAASNLQALSRALHFDWIFTGRLYRTTYDLSGT